MATLATHGDGCDQCGTIHQSDEPCPEPASATEEASEEAKQAFIQAMMLAHTGRV